MCRLGLAPPGVSFFAGVVGCICLGSSTLATAPDGEPYRVNGPMYTPSISAQYHEHVYGKYAKSPAGITEGEAYFEVMSIMGSVYRAVCYGTGTTQ